MTSTLSSSPSISLAGPQSAAVTTAREEAARPKLIALSPAIAQAAKRRDVPGGLHRVVLGTEQQQQRQHDERDGGGDHDEDPHPGQLGAGQRMVGRSDDG